MMEIIEQLSEMYNKKRDNLKRYAAKPNAEDFAIQKQNEELAILHNIINELSKFELLDIWQSIDDELRRLLKEDPELGIFKIDLHLNNGKENFGYLSGEYPLS